MLRQLNDNDGDHGLSQIQGVPTDQRYAKANRDTGLAEGANFNPNFCIPSLK